MRTVVVMLLIATISRLASAQGVSIDASLISEPQRHGLAEVNGRPGFGLNVDWEISANLFVGASGYITSNAPAPQRTKNIAPFVGVNFGAADGVQFSLMAIHRIFPGDFVIDWDFTDLQLDVGFSPSLGLTITATDDYYGMGMRSTSGALEYAHDFSNQLYGRVKAGYVDVDSPLIESFSFGVLGLGYRFGRFSVEGGYRINDAEPFRAFREPQTRNRLMLTVNWLAY